MNAEIIAVGSEMLTPYRQDTNSLYITEKLNELGVAIAFKTIAGDKTEAFGGCDPPRTGARGYCGALGRPRSHGRRPDPRSCCRSAGREGEA